MKVLIINGPNLNMLGKRDKTQYGVKTLDEINKELTAYSPFELIFFQSNHEGDIIDEIQKAFFDKVDGIIINAGGYTHTSVAIHDALEIYKGPKVEVHLSDVYNREEFRKTNFIKDVCDYSVVGKKELGYFIAIDYLKKFYNVV